ncbi:MAG: GNAT family N-acetyltransferase [Lapillicoccus sp.]
MGDDDPARLTVGLRPIELRRVLPQEWEGHRHLRLEMLLDAPDAFWTTHAEAAAMDEAQWRARISTTFHVMATLDAVPVGSVGMWSGPDPDPDVAHLIAMYVAPPVRGQGVGERLVAAVLDEAVARGHRRVVLEVTGNNAPAIALYTRMGFQPTGVRRSHPRRGDLQELEMVWTAPGEAGDAGDAASPGPGSSGVPI